MKGVSAATRQATHENETSGKRPVCPPVPCPPVPRTRQRWETGGRQPSSHVMATPFWLLLGDPYSDIQTSAQ